MGFGEAIAQGITMGLGQGANQYFTDMRREKMDARKLARKFDNFKKESDYSAAISAEQTKRKQEYESTQLEEQRKYLKEQTQEERKYQTGRFKQEQATRFNYAKKTAKFQMGYEDISTKTAQLTAYEKAVKMPLKELVYQNATKASLNFPKSDRERFIRDYMSRNNGIDRVKALDMAGLTLPDYSQYVNNPDFADAIPKARIAGLQDFPGMDDVFAYEPPQEPEEVEAGAMEGERWQVEQTQRRQAYTQSITSDGYLIQQGVTEVDPMVLNTIDSSLQFGKQDAMYVDNATGIEVNRVNDVVNRGLQNGTMAIVDGTVMPATKAQKIQELQAEYESSMEMPMETEGAPMEMPMEPEEVPMEAPLTTQEKVRQEKLIQEQTKRYRTEATEIGSKLANENITGVVDAIGTAEADLKGLDADSMSYVYSALNAVDGKVPDAMKALAKMNDPKAKEAYMAMQSLMGVLNVELKDRSGAAVTESEAIRFYKELGQASAMGSLEETLRGLSNLRQQKLSKAEGYFQGREQGVIDQLFETSPKYREYWDESETYGSDEGKARGSMRTEIQTVAKDLLDQGASVEDIDAYLNEVYGEDATALGLELPKLN